MLEEGERVAALEASAGVAPGQGGGVAGAATDSLDFSGSSDSTTLARSHAGARLESSDPLALFEPARSPETTTANAPTSSPPAHSPFSSPSSSPAPAQAPPGTAALFAPLQGTIVSIEVAPGARVHAGQPLLIMEAMKMEHVIAAPQSGHVRAIAVVPRETVYEGHALLFIEPAEVEGELEVSDDAIEAAAQWAFDHGHRVLVDPAPARPVSAALIACRPILTPNAGEAGELSGEKSPATAAKELALMTGSPVAITMGERGVVVVDGDLVEKLPSYRVDVVDTTGAGDTFSGALAVNLSESMPFAQAVQRAQAAAAISTRAAGARAGMPAKSELAVFLAGSAMP